MEILITDRTDAGPRDSLRRWRGLGRIFGLSSLRSLLVCACLVTGPQLLVGAERGPEFHEYDLKAAFVYNFTQFVQWPSSAFAEPEAPFVIGVLGHDPFGGMLDALVDKESVNGRQLVIERYRSFDDIDHCNILFVSRGDVARVRSRLPELARRHILTVGDSEGFERQGGVIGLATDREHVRVRINLEAARSAGLVISSKLLRAAEVVDANTQGMIPWASHPSSEG